MALSEKTISKHNLKRAEVFAEHGLGDHDVAYAKPQFAGYGAGGDVDCCLCGHRHIAWQFAIHFDTPDVATMLGKVSTGLIRTEEVTLQYVGSKCITDWLDAVPESVAKLAALKVWAAEMAKCNAAKKSKVVHDLCVEAGYEDAGDAYDVYVAAKAEARARKAKVAWHVRKALKRNASGVCNSTCARKTCQNWLAHLDTLIAAINAAPKPAPKAKAATPQPPVAASAASDPLAKLSAEDRDLILRGRKAWAGGKASLSEKGRAAFKDIGGRVVKYGSFISNPQRGYYTALLTRMEGAQAAPAPKATNQPAPKAKPAPTPKKSPSGIEGARY